MKIWQDFLRSCCTPRTILPTDKAQCCICKKQIERGEVPTICTSHCPFSLLQAGRQNTVTEVMEIQLTREGGFFEQMPVPFQVNVLVSDIWHAYNNVEVLPVFTSKPEFPSSLKDLLSRFGPMATRIHFPCVPADGSHTVFSWDPLSTREPVLAHQLPPPLHLHRHLCLLLEHIVVRLHPSLLTLPPSTQASLGTRRE